MSLNIFVSFKQCTNKSRPKKKINLILKTSYALSTSRRLSRSHVEESDIHIDISIDIRTEHALRSNYNFEINVPTGRHVEHIPTEITDTWRPSWDCTCNDHRAKERTRCRVSTRRRAMEDGTTCIIGNDAYKVACTLIWMSHDSNFVNYDLHVHWSIHDLHNTRDKCAIRYSHMRRVSISSRSRLRLHAANYRSDLSEDTFCITDKRRWDLFSLREIQLQSWYIVKKTALTSDVHDKWPIDKLWACNGK